MFQQSVIASPDEIGKKQSLDTRNSMGLLSRSAQTAGRLTAPCNDRRKYNVVLETIH